MKLLAVSSLLVSIPAALCALPEDITAKPLPEGCASYPQYDAETDIAGPWLLEVGDNAENSNIRGFFDTGVYNVGIKGGKPYMRWGHITMPTTNQIAHQVCRCKAGILETWTSIDLTAAGAPTNVQWTPLTISPYPYDASLMWKMPEGLSVKAFEHYRDGVKQDGVWLGAYDNTTLWGFQYQTANQGSSGLDYYYMRLLGPNSADPTTGEALKGNETRGFIKIQE